MTLRCAKNLQHTLSVALLLVFLPFAICYLVFGILYYCCEWMMGVARRINFFFGRYLLIHSDEVQSGIIQNQDVLKYDTASIAYRVLKIEKNKNQNKE